MRPLFTFLVATLFFVALGAQHGINDQSVFPTDFVVVSPSSISGIYNYGTQASNPGSEWGPRLSEDVQGELVWAFNDSDSLGCNAGGEIQTDLSGKMAFIRRGGCSFVEKVLNAQQAGAIGVVIVNNYEDELENEQTLIDMRSFNETGSDFVTIPAVFVSRATGELLQTAIDNGEAPIIRFNVKTLYDASVAWSYRAPVDNYPPYRYSVNYVNPDEQNEVEVTVTTRVYNEEGSQLASFNASSIVASLADSVIVMAEEDVFIPTEPGMYRVIFSQDQTNEKVKRNFVVSEYTYGNDAVNAIADYIPVGPSQEQYDSAGGFYESASLIVTPEDAETTVATYVSFGLTNPEDFYDPFTGGEDFLVLVYSGAFPNVDSAGFDDLTVISGAIYTIPPNYIADEIFFVELEEPAVLSPGGTYYVSVRKTAGVGTGNAPSFVGSLVNTPRVVPANDGESMIYPAPLQLGEFSGTGQDGMSVWTRLHLDPFDPFHFCPPFIYNDTFPILIDNTIEFLDANQVIISPNPVQDKFNLTLDLNSTLSQAIVRVIDVNGRLMGQYKYDQVTAAPIQIDVNNLRSGTYFLSVSTPEGYRMKKFIKQ